MDMQLSRAQFCSCCRTFWMWTTKVNRVINHRNRGIVGKHFHFDEINESRHLGRSFVKMVKSLGPNKDRGVVGKHFHF